MNPVATPFFFYFLSALALISGVLVITRKNPVHSAIALIFTLLSLAGLYLMLYAPFVAGVQIILYAGGIMVLFLFVIMLVNLDESVRQRQFNKHWLVALACALAVGAEVFYFLRQGAAAFRLAQVTALAPAPGVGNVQQIGDVLFSEYLLPFEVASVLLLAAVVGSVVMAKKRV